jgi:hypothetical protein
LTIDRPNAAGDLLSATHDYRTLRLLPEFIWGFLLSEGIDIVEKLLRRAEEMRAVCQINASTTAAEADEFTDLISEVKPLRGAGWKIVNTGTIDPYRLSWGDVSLTNAGSKYLRPYLHYDKRRVSENRRSQYNSPKLIFAKMANRIEAAFDHEGQYASINTNFAFANGEAGFFYLGLLNSKLLTWIYEQYFGALRMSGGYLQFQAPQLRCLPVLRFSPTEEGMRNIADLAKQYSQNKGEDLLPKIDKLVYELFALQEGEIGRIENSSYSSKKQ